MANTKLNNKTQYKQNAKAATTSFSKQQPQAIELEEVVLGGMMLDKDAVARVIDILNVGVFYVRKHQLIFEAIQNMFAKSEPVDIMTVVEELRKLGMLDEVGGAFYIIQLTNRVGSTVNIEYHSRILLEKYTMRELIRTSDISCK